VSWSTDCGHREKDAHSCEKGDDLEEGVSELVRTLLTSVGGSNAADVRRRFVLIAHGCCKQCDKQEDGLLVVVPAGSKGDWRDTELLVRFEMGSVDKPLLDDLLGEHHQERMKVDELGLFHSVLVASETGKSSEGI